MNKEILASKMRVVFSIRFTERNSHIALITMIIVGMHFSRR